MKSSNAMTKRRPSGEILYLDDRPENIAVGEARGWQTVLHESPENTRAAFTRLGVIDIHD